MILKMAGNNAVVMGLLLNLTKTGNNLEFIGTFEWFQVQINQTDFKDVSGSVVFLDTY